MAQSIAPTEKVLATANFLDKDGKPTTLPAGIVPTWVSDNVAVCTVDPSVDATGLTVSVVAVAAGTANINMSAVIDPTLTITATAAVLVTPAVAGAPASATITFGAPTPK